MTNQAENGLSFSQAIIETQSLIDQINSDELSEVEIQQLVTSIFSTRNGGRGFFVSYLTSELSLADNPSLGIINGLKASSEISSDLLVKNLAMSSAMKIIHIRNNDLNEFEGSQKVCQRTSILIKKLDSSLIKIKLQKLFATIDRSDTEYQEFLDRWDYDAEQKQAIQSAISDILKD